MNKIQLLSIVIILLSITLISAYKDYDELELKNGYINFNPKDRINTKDIKIYEDKIIIEGTFEKRESKGTGSMLPLLFKGATYFYTDPRSPRDIKKGDIIVFKKPKEMIKNGFKRKGTLVIHRVIKKGIDLKGFYFYTAGDNNQKEDGAKIRFKDITKVMVGVIW